MQKRTIGLGREIKSATRLGLWLGVFASACLMASGATASEVVDLRIGAHPEFTRIVFELDRPTGYRIERSVGPDGNPELVVSLDANSIPRKVRSQKSLIGLIRITPKGSGSVAHIELNREGLKLKEMILANPPRIVLDVLGPKASTSGTPVASLSKPRVAAVAVKKPAAPKQAPAKKLPARVVPKTKPAPQIATKPKTGSLKPVVAPTPAVPKAAPVVSPKAALPVEIVVLDEPSEGGLPGMGTAMLSQTNRPSDRLAGLKPSAERLPGLEPPFPSEGANADEEMGTGTVAFLVALVIVFAAGVVYFRRRGDPEVLDSESESTYAPPGPRLGGNPFSEAVESEEGNPESALEATEAPQPFALTQEDADSEGRRLEASDLDLDHEDDDKPVEPVDEPLIGYSLGQSLAESGAPTASAAPFASSQSVVAESPSAGGFAQTESPPVVEVAGVTEAFEGRIAELESRLEEARDARERLERQVAAQTEELRVQRAAIARTQRAVRNLNRNGEEAPTEPALRDPQ